jgi:hypothetical protein
LLIRFLRSNLNWLSKSFENHKQWADQESNHKSIPKMPAFFLSSIYLKNMDQHIIKSFTFGFLTCLFLLPNIYAIAQVGSIRGRIIDSKNLEPIPFANVFIDNTTMGTVTDLNGEFEIKNIRRPGVYELIVSFVGYIPYKQKISLTIDQFILPVVRLSPDAQELNTVEVKGTRDTQWEKKLKKFEKVFLGSDKSDQCTILNPWVIDFFTDSEKKFRAKANAPIEIENKTLGYLITFYLTNFKYDNTTYLIEGNARFEDLVRADETIRMQWELKRKSTYEHSRQHLFKSIINHTIKGEGFELYTEIPGFEEPFARSTYFYPELNKTLMRYDTSNLVSFISQKDIYKISFKGRLEVHYSKEKAPVRLYRDYSGQVSWLTLRRGSVLVNKDGAELTPSDVTVSGAISSDRISKMLPIDYAPPEIGNAEEVNQQKISFLQEKIYIHTDKPYYYAGEPLWFKGYINYVSPEWRDSLSQTVYVELINPKKKIVSTKTLQIDSGFFHNDFILPDTLQAGNYFLRAYTNLNRNFGDSSLYVKQISVLDIVDKVNENLVENSGIAKDSLILIKPNKKKYKAREKIILTFSTKNEEGEPEAANISVSVTDAQQVASIAEHENIMESFPIKNLKLIKGSDIIFPAEHGIAFTGKFLSSKGKPEETMLTLLQLKPPNMILAETNKEGVFSVTGLKFYDSSTFALKTEKIKEHANAKIELLPRSIPSITFKEHAVDFSVQTTQSQQRIFSEYEKPKDVRLLNSVEIKASRTPEEYTKEYRSKRPYGKPDFVLKAKDINTGTGNLLLSIQGQFPGLNVRQDPDGRWVVYLQRSISIANAAEVLVTVNDNVVGGTPESILNSINPNNVESIELKKGINVLYGGLGGNGILSIYTKLGAAEGEDLKVAPNFQTIKIAGYSRSREFKFPLYDEKETDTRMADYRSTLFWNPSIEMNDVTGTSSITFFAADLPGKYRVVAEGVNKNGEAIRGEYFIEIEK